MRSVVISCEKVKFDDDFLEGQPDERRLIQTVNVGSEQNEVVELGTGRSFLCAPRSATGATPRPVAAIPPPRHVHRRPPKGADLHPSRSEGNKKIPPPAGWRSGGELPARRTPRGVEPIRRGSGRRRRTSWAGRGAGSSRHRRHQKVYPEWRKLRRSTQCRCSVRRRRFELRRCRPR